MTNAFVERLRGYAPLSATDQTSLEAACESVRSFPAGYDLIREGAEPNAVFVVLEGWAFSYKLLPSGARQIIAFMMPGDFCDAHVAASAEMDHRICTLTTARIATIARAKFEELVDTLPNLRKALRWAQLVDEGVLRATIVSLGRRNSLERVAHLLCETCLRMREVGLANGGPCEVPFTQILLADAVGLTPVHTNRVVKKLRSAGALDTRPRSLIVSDLPRMAQIAGFDSTYLDRRAAPS